MDTATAERYVKEGIEFLDFVAEVQPGGFVPKDWRKGIDLDRLDQNHSHVCILGQLGAPFGCDYWQVSERISKSTKIDEVPEHLRYIMMSLSFGNFTGQSSGFVFDSYWPNDRPVGEMVTEAWIKALSKKSE